MKKKIAMAIQINGTAKKKKSTRWMGVYVSSKKNKMENKEEKVFLFGNF